MKPSTPLKKTRKRHPSRSYTHAFRKWIISLITALIVLGCGWLFEDISTIRYPDSGSPALFYSTENRDDLGLILETAIRNAKKSVTLMIYSLSDARIIKSLYDKSLEGCCVKVICDVKNANGLEESLGSKVELIKFFTPALMHLKILVIDEKQTWIGSANMTRGSLRYYGNLVAAIDSEALATAATLKADSYTHSGRLKTFPLQQFSAGGQKIELCFLPDDRGAVNRLKKLIHSAEKTLRIAMYTWTHQDLASAIVDAKNRGVDVRVMIDHSSTVGPSKKIVHLLKKQGVTIKKNRNKNTLLHHKFLWIDGNILVHGSANWTENAFKQNDDCYMIFYDLNKEQQLCIEQTWQSIENDSIAI